MCTTSVPMGRKSTKKGGGGTEARRRGEPARGGQAREPEPWEHPCPRRPALSCKSLCHKELRNIGRRPQVSWIGHLKRECLNLLFCFSLRQLDHIVQTYVLYHNKFRPHQGLGNRPPDVLEDQLPTLLEVAGESIRCRRWLGGLLRHYEHQAA